MTAPISGQFLPRLDADEYCAEIEKFMRKFGIECMCVSYGLPVTGGGTTFAFSAHGMTVDERETMAAYVDAALQQIKKKGAH